MERAGVKTISTAVKSDHWALCLEYMSHRVKQQSFNTWLKPTTGNLSENGKFVVRVRNQFVSDWLQNHFRELIEEAIAEILGTSHSLVFELNDESAKDQASLKLYDRNTLSETTGNGNGNGSTRPKSSLSQRYDFKSLVVGDFTNSLMLRPWRLLRRPALPAIIRFIFMAAPASAQLTLFRLWAMR